MTNPAPGTLAARLAYLISLVPGLDLKAVDVLAGLKSGGHTGQIVRGDKPSPSASTVVALARVLGTSAEWLLLGDDAARGRRAPSQRRVREAVREARCGGGGHVARVLTARAARKAARPSSRRVPTGRTRAGA